MSASNLKAYFIKEALSASTLGEAETYLLLIQHLSVATFVINAEGYVVIWNEACERLTGMPAHEIIGSNEYWSAFYAEKRPCLADFILSGDRTGFTQYYEVSSEPQINPLGLSAESWAVLPRRGKRLYLGFDVNPVYDGAGNLIAVVETIRDLTAHKLMQKTLQGLAEMDPLTGLPNRRGFDNRLLVEWSRAKRQSEPISLLVIDVDYFKQYNDKHGHQRGDECLRAIARTLASSVLRDTDMAARIGGEEFAVILPNTRASGSLIVAERMRAAIEAALIRHGAADVGDFVTVSIGVATSPPRIEMQDLFGAADAALYRAKRRGRNRVERAASARQDLWERESA